jgi:acetyl-CoA synthetase
MSPAFKHNEATYQFKLARDCLLRHRDDLAAARKVFAWPKLSHFNWAQDWFDAVARAKPDATALWVVTPQSEHSVSFSSLAARSRQVATWLASQGIGEGDRLLLCLRNGFALYEIILAAIRLRAVVIPTYLTVGREDLSERIEQGRITCLIADASVAERMGMPGGSTLKRIVVSGGIGFNQSSGLEGWIDFSASFLTKRRYGARVKTPAQMPSFGYFTSGTTAKPKLVMHSHVSYAIGHLSSMYWNGVMPGDVHLNVSSPGWAKHSWSSLFVPWNAEATLVVLDAPEASPAFVRSVMERHSVSTFCAPPTFWRRLAVEGMGDKPSRLREATGAGEPLERSLIDTVRKAWGIDLRDGYGQSETTGQIGNPPGASIEEGAMGMPLPGYDIVLVDPQTGEPDETEGEICIDLTNRPLGMMLGYDADPERTARVLGERYYHTGDLARRDGKGRFHFIGRTDDVFKSFDFRVSPFELERALLSHPAVAEAVIVPKPDPIGFEVPKAFVRLRAGEVPSLALTHAMVDWMAKRVAKELLPRSFAFVEALPKTNSGKLLRRVLKEQERRHEPAAETRIEFEVAA